MLALKGSCTLGCAGLEKYHRVPGRLRVIVFSSAAGLSLSDAVYTF
jgi:hypothetical protein